MLNAYKKFWTNYVNFTGRSSRSDFWWVVLVHAIIMIPLGSIVISSFLSILFSFVGAVGGGYYDTEMSGLFFIVFVLFGAYILAIFIPQIALTVRRLRDANFHWAFIFLWAGPFILVRIDIDIFNTLGVLATLPCSIALIVLLCQPSKNPQIVAQQTAFQGQNGQFQGQNPNQGQAQASAFQQPVQPQATVAGQQEPQVNAFQAQQPVTPQEAQNTAFQAQQPVTPQEPQANAFQAQQPVAPQEPAVEGSQEVPEQQVATPQGSESVAPEARATNSQSAEENE